MKKQTQTMLAKKKILAKKVSPQNHCKASKQGNKPGRRVYPALDTLLKTPGHERDVYLRYKIQEMHQEGYTPARISRRLACTRATVYRWMNRATTKAEPKPGRPRSARTQRNTKIIRSILQAHHYKPLTLRQLHAKAANKGVKMHVRTLRKIKCGDLGYFGRQAKKK